MLRFDTAYEPVRNYYRQEHLQFFSKYRYPFYGFTYELQIDQVKAFAKARQCSIYFTLCYFFTKALQPLPDFRYRLLDDELVLYRTLNLSMVVPNEKGLFSFARVPFQTDAEACIRQATASAKNVGFHAHLAEEKHHKNFVYYSVLPKVPFTSLSHVPSDSPDDAEPKVSFGQFFERDGGLWTPVGIQVNHRFIDGKALGEMVEQVRATFAAPC